MSYTSAMAPCSGWSQLCVHVPRLA
jgi:hypothetical protein